MTAGVSTGAGAALAPATAEPAFASPSLPAADGALNGFEKAALGRGGSVGVDALTAGVALLLPHEGILNDGGVAMAAGGGSGAETVAFSGGADSPAAVEGASADIASVEAICASAATAGAASALGATEGTGALSVPPAFLSDQLGFEPPLLPPAVADDGNLNAPNILEDLRKNELLRRTPQDVRSRAT